MRNVLPILAPITDSCSPHQAIQPRLVHLLLLAPGQVISSSSTCVAGPTKGDGSSDCGQGNSRVGMISREAYGHLT